MGDPSGLVIQLQDPSYCGGGGALGDRCGSPESAPMSGSLSLDGLSHLTINVPDPAATNAFYQKAFGMDTQTYQAASPVMGVGPGVHFLMFIGSGRGGARINHACLSMENFDVERILGALEDHDITPRSGGPGGSGPLRHWVTMRMPNPASGSGTIAPVPIALAFQSNLSKIFIDLKVETLEWYGFISLLSRGLQPDAQILPMPWGMSTGFWVRQILHSKKQPFSNYGWYENPEVDRLLDEATSTTDLAKSKELFARVNQIVVNEDVAVIPALIDLSPTAYQPYVKNFVLQHENWFVLHEVDIEK